MSVRQKLGGLRQVQEDGKRMAATLSSMFRAQVIADRAAGLNAITDDMIIGAAGVVQYPAYQDNHDYKRGEIFMSGGLYYEVVADHTSSAAYPVATTFAYYRLVELTHTGAADDPIPYPDTAGTVVNVINGKYYSYKGGVYLAKADMPDCVWPPDTPGMWQWELIGGNNE